MYPKFDPTLPFVCLFDFRSVYDDGLQSSEICMKLFHQV